MESPFLEGFRLETGKIPPRAGWESPFLKGFTSPVDVAFGDTVSGGLGSAGGAVGLDGLRGLFQPEGFHDSIP